MHPFPHRYLAQVQASETGSVELSSPGLPALASAPPVEFDGPGDRWSPETLLVAAVADCFTLTFRAVAGASKFGWNGLRVAAEGVVDRVEGAIRFTQVSIRARLVVPAGTDRDRARRLLEKAKRSCLITSSLSAETSLDCEIEEG